MDADRFERVIRSLTTASSRRQALGGVFGTILGTVAGAPFQGRAAKGKKGKGGKGKGKGKKRSPAPVLPPPPPPITCLDPALPNVCTRTRSCLPACAPDKSFDPATCRCLCRERQACCECFGGTLPPLCFEFVPGGDAEDCQNVCMAQGLTSSRFVSDGRAECRTPGATTCTTICSDDL